MKDLQSIYEKCKKNVEALGYKVGNIVSVESVPRGKVPNGLCIYNGKGEYYIQIDRDFLEDDCPIEITEAIIYHEIVHTVTGRWHDEAFDNVADHLTSEYHLITCKINNDPLRNGEYSIGGAPLSHGYLLKKFKYAVLCTDCGRILDPSCHEKKKYRNLYGYSCPICNSENLKVISGNKTSSGGSFNFGQCILFASPATPGSCLQAYTARTVLRQRGSDPELSVE